MAQINRSPRSYIGGWLRIGVVLLVAIMSLGFAGLCNKKDKDKDVVVGSSAPPPPPAPPGTTLHLRSGGILSTTAPSDPGTTSTSSFRLGANSEWTITLSGDITGTDYSMYLWAIALGTSFDVAIILKQGAAETVLVSWTGLTTDSDTTFKVVERSTTGPDPTAVSGDLLILRITSANDADWVRIRYNNPTIDSTILVPEFP